MPTDDNGDYRVTTEQHREVINLASAILNGLYTLPGPHEAMDALAIALGDVCLACMRKGHTVEQFRQDFQKFLDARLEDAQKAAASEKNQLQ